MYQVIVLIDLSFAHLVLIKSEIKTWTEQRGFNHFQSFVQMVFIHENKTLSKTISTIMMKRMVQEGLSWNMVGENGGKWRIYRLTILFLAIMGICLWITGPINLNICTVVLCYSQKNLFSFYLLTEFQEPQLTTWIWATGSWSTRRRNAVIAPTAKDNSLATATMEDGN